MSLAAPERFQGLDRFEARRQVVAEFEAAGLLVKVGAAPARGGTLLPLRYGDRAPPLGAVVREDGAARPPRPGPVPGRHPAVHSRAPGRRLRPVARGHPRLVHLPPALVGASHSGMVLRGAPVRPHQREPHRPASSAPTAAGRCVRTRTCSTPGSAPGWCPFPASGWPDQTDDLRTYYPGHTLVSAPEILFFWVARMIMSGIHFMGEAPYTRMYLHGTVRDTQHRKMSKSLGNGIDPLQVVERYGADALRYSLISGMSVGTDVILDPNDLESSFGPARNFANKLWNAGRFILSNLEGPPRPLAGRAGGGAPGRAHPGRPLDHRALRGHRPGGDRGLRALPAERGGRAPSIGSSGATSPTGTSSRSSPGCTAISLGATWPVPSPPRPSTSPSACCIR